MSISIQRVDDSQREQWDEYVNNHPAATAYHQWAFGAACVATYRPTPYYFVASNQQGCIVGTLPLFHIKSRLFDNALVSLPYCDYGGILADSEDIAQQLLDEALALYTQLRCNALELRQTFEIAPLSSLSQQAQAGLHGFAQLNQTKVRMRLTLPVSVEELWQSFSPKLRAQIRKPQKEGCICKSGGTELLDDFYTVFRRNMRDLGSPVHAKAMQRHVVQQFAQRGRIFVVYHHDQPIACSVTIGSHQTLINPWASFDKRFPKLAANMLLYWQMLEYACAEGYRSFDFGRSTAGEGTYRFKSQWGAQPEALWWYRISRKPTQHDSKPGRMVELWKKLPLAVATFMGPIIRGKIHL